MPRITKAEAPVVVDVPEYEGRLVHRYADHDETFLPGEHHYAEPGHVPLAFAGTEVVEFSPTNALSRTLAVVGQAMAAQRTAGV